MMRHKLLLVFIGIFGWYQTSASASAQSPSSIAGRTIQLTVSSGTFPFASSGSYRMLPSATDARYAIVPISGNIGASEGTYTYTKTGSSTAALAVSDENNGPLQAVCAFSSATAGTFVMTSSLFAGGRQTGSFVVYSGSSPGSIAGRTFTVSVTSGEFPFADGGSYQFIAAPTGNAYTVVGIGEIPNSSGTYTYSQKSPTTGVITFTDANVGTGLSQQLSFDSATSGSGYLRLVGSSGYQTAIFSMSSPVAAPTITLQPQSQTVNPGATVVFSVNANGTLPLTFQWRKSGVNIAGGNGAILTISNVRSSDAGTYSVLVSNSAGSITSTDASLIVMEGPSILAHPVGITAKAGTDIPLTVSASGSAPLSYQWRFNGRDIAGATGPSYMLGNVQPDQSGDYSVRIRNSAGTVESFTASVLIWMGATIQPVLLYPSGPDTNRQIRLVQLQPRARYRVQFTPNFARWFELTNIIADGTVAEALHPVATNLPKMFYRIVSP